ncbi:16447_t:CDS:2, partial [Dentiscutata heterogama]
PARRRQFSERENFTNNERVRNLALSDSEIPTATYNNRQNWWETLSNLCNNCRINTYNPTWKRLCPECGSQLLSSEPKNFCCNNMLRRTIPPLHPLPLTLQNLYNSDPDNFCHNSRQYNSLFSFTVFGYMGGVVRLPHPHAFAINGRAYHQVYPANAKGYPTNWFVYDAEARNCVANQRKLDQEIVKLIEQELATVNPFVRGLYQLYDVDYPQARLIIQQPTNNAEVAACTIIHSTAVIRERHVQIWRVDPKNSKLQKISQVDYYRYRIMSETRFHLLGRLFNEYLVDMFSRADDERLQYIRQEQYRFKKKDYENDETVYDEAELYPKNIYLPASHTLSYRWSYKKMMDALAAVIKQYMIHKCTSRCVQHGNSCHWNYPKPLRESTTVNEYSHVHYRRHTENDENIVPYNPFLLLKLHSHINVKVASTSHVYYELYTFTYAKDLVNQQSLPPNNYLEKEQEGCQRCIVKPYKPNHTHVTRMNIIRPCVGEKYYLRMLLSCHAARSFRELCIVNDTLYSNFQDAARAFGLLEDVNENEQCFAEAVTYKCTPAQLRLPFCHLILEGENEALMWIASFLEEHGSQITQFGLPQPSEHLDEITRIQARYNDYNTLIATRDKMISKLNFEQKSIYQKIMNHVYELKRPVRDVHDLGYSQLMDKIDDGVDGEDVSLALLKMTHEINDVIDFAFPETVLNEPNKCQKCAILCLLNSEVESINEIILQRLRGDAVDLYSTDSLADDDTRTNQAQRNMISVELLNTFNASEIPKHCLTLKKGCVATIMRNLSIHDGLCKNSRVIILDIGQRLVTVQNPAMGSVIYLPRITFLFCVPQFPFKISRHQFPLRLAYSSTFNSSQGLTLDRVALNLYTPVFSHRQLYTALTRVRQ